MATPTYWADQLFNKIISTRSNRREFLKSTTAAGLSLSALGGIGALSGCASVQKPRVKNPLQKEIEDLMWGSSNPARVDSLITIMNDHGIAKNNPDVTRTAAEALVPHTGEKVFEALTTAYDKFPTDGKLQSYFVQLLAENYAVNPEARLDILRFYFSHMIKDKASAQVQRTIFSVLIFINNTAYRMLREHLRAVRLANHNGLELVRELFVEFMIQQIYPTFNAFERWDEDEIVSQFKFRRFGNRYVDYLKFVKVDPSAGKYEEQILIDEEMFRVTDKKMQDWRNQLHDKDHKKRIDAMLNLDEIKQLTDDDRILFIKMLNDESESPEIRRVILSILGSDLQISQDVQGHLVKYLKHTNNDLALAAAKALRFKEGLPAKNILGILAQKDENLRQQLGIMVLSSLDAPETFQVLVKSIIMTDPKNIADKKRRVDELRIWYLRLGDNRDEVVALATSLVSNDNRQMVIKYLRDISMINIWTPMPMKWFVFSPSTASGFIFDSSREDVLDADVRQLEQIAKKFGV